MRVLASLCILGLAACDGLVADSSPVEAAPEVVTATLSVPEGVGCVRLKLSGPRNRNFVQSVSRDGDVLVDLGNLPLGTYSLSGDAFAAECPVMGDVVWSAATVSFDVRAGGATLDVSLVFVQHPGVVATGGFEPRIVQIHAERYMVVALSSAGEIFAWGTPEGDYLQAVDGDRPQRLGVLDGAVAFSSSTSLICTIDGDGIVSCVGHSNAGQIVGIAGGGSKNPVVIELPGPAIDIQISGQTVCALLANGDMYCWGNTTNMPTYGCQASNCPPTLYQFNTSVSAIARSAFGFVFLYADGRAAVTRSTNSYWIQRAEAVFDSPEVAGRDATGEVYMFDYAVDGLVAVPDLHGALDASAAYQSLCAIDTAGDLYCRGDEPGTGAANSPSLVYVASDAVDVSLAQNIACYADAVSGAWCWGDNSWGQLGTGDRDYKYQPARVAF